MSPNERYDYKAKSLKNSQIITQSKYSSILFSFHIIRIGLSNNYLLQTSRIGTNRQYLSFSRRAPKLRPRTTQANSTQQLLRITARVRSGLYPRSSLL